MPNRDIIAIGASAGGIEALLELAPALPADLPAAILVVLHLPENAASQIPALLSRRGPLPASHAEEGQPISPGRIFVGPPGVHLTVEDGQLRLARTPRENNVRPAIDALFRTAANHYRSRAVGVLLSGTLDDGTAGLLRIKMRGGVAMVQHPDDALFTSMPATALKFVEVDYSLPVSAMAPVLSALARGRGASGEGVSMTAKTPGDGENMVAQSRRQWEDGIETAGQQSVLTCPECGGVLWELDNVVPMLRYKCHTGHAYSADSLVSAQDAEVEASLWGSVRRLEEIHSLALRLEKHARDHGHAEQADSLQQRARLAKRQADAVRQIIMQGENLEAAAS